MHNMCTRFSSKLNVFANQQGSYDSANIDKATYKFIKIIIFDLAKIP